MSVEYHNKLLTETRSHYDEFPFIEGGLNRITWWREYLQPFLPDKDVRGAANHRRRF